MEASDRPGAKKDWPSGLLSLRSTAVGDEYACLTRTYAFAGNAGLNGNRTSQATYGADTATGECTTTGTALSTASFTIDAADRLSASGMTVDGDVVLWYFLV